MQDLVALGTGNSRLMKSNIPANTTLSQFIQMLNNGTFPYDIGPLNPAGISQEGTPLNKGTMLSDTTAALYGLGVEAVPDDILKGLYRPIGTIEDTIRTDMGDKWLLCNGDPVDASSYPELSALLKPTPSSNTQIKIGTFEYLSDLTYNKEKSLYFAINRNAETGTRKEGEVLSTSDPNGTWNTIKTIKKYFPSYIAAHGNEIVVIVNDADGIIFKAWYSGDNGASWSNPDDAPEIINTRVEDGLFNCFTYFNGYWILGGYYKYSPAIWYTANPSTGTWTRKILTNTSNRCAVQQFSTSDTTCACIIDVNVSDMGSYKRIYYTSNVAGSWSSVKLDSIFEGLAWDSETSFVYGDGYWVVTAEDQIAYSENLTNWSLIRGIPIEKDNERMLGYSKGTWILLDFKKTSNTDDVKIKYSTTTPPSSFSEYGTSIKGYINYSYIVNDYIIIGDGNYPVNCTKLTPSLPAISSGTHYSYIKAKN